MTLAIVVGLGIAAYFAREQTASLSQDAAHYQQQATVLCAQDPRLKGWYMQYATYSGATLAQTVWTHHDSTTTCGVQFGKVVSFIQERGR